MGCSSVAAGCWEPLRTRRKTVAAAKTVAVTGAASVMSFTNTDFAVGASTAAIATTVSSRDHPAVDSGEQLLTHLVGEGQNSDWSSSR